MNELSEPVRWLLGILLTGSVAAVAWLIRLERRLNSKLDTSKFEERGKEQYAETAALRRELMSYLEQMNERSEAREKYLHEFKHSMMNYLNNLNLKLHLIAQKQGVKLPPMSDTEEGR